MSEGQLEGRAAAWVADRVLTGDASCAADMGGEYSPDGWQIGEDMVRHVQKYIDIVQRHGAPRPEHDVTIFDGLVSGRPDCYSVDDGKTFRAYELKYGWKIVEPKGLTQLLLAGVAFARLPENRIISLEVFQPRPYHPDGPLRKWVIGPDELYQWSKWLHERAVATLVSKPLATPGEHCDHCPRNGNCPTLDQNVFAAFEVFSNTTRPKRIGASELADKYRSMLMAERLIASCRKGVEAEINARIGREHFPGFVIEPRDGNREFTNTPTDRHIMTGVDPFKKVEKTPAEMEREGADVDGMTTRGFAGFKLAPWDSSKIDRMMKPPHKDEDGK